MPKVPTEFEKEIGRKIERLRLQLGESQEEFAERFGVAQGSISRWEKGFPPWNKYREGIAKLADMTVASFFHSMDQPLLVPIVGEITAKGSVSLFEKPTPGSPIEHIHLTLAEDEQIGIKVKGDYLFPAYRDGDSLIGHKLSGGAIESAVGKDCIVKISEEHGMICIVRRGTEPGRYTLRALDQRDDDVENTPLEWAAPISKIFRGD